jgi:hypothetical protein
LAAKATFGITRPLFRVTVMESADATKANVLECTAISQAVCENTIRIAVGHSEISFLEISPIKISLANMYPDTGPKDPLSELDY